MKRVYTSLSLLTLTSPVYAEVSDKVPGYLSMVLWQLGVALLLVVGVLTGWRVFKGLALLLSVLLLWTQADFMFLDSEIYRLAVGEQGPAYAVTNASQLGAWVLLVVLSAWLCVKRRG